MRKLILQGEVYSFTANVYTLTLNQVLRFFVSTP